MFRKLFYFLIFSLVILGLLAIIFSKPKKESQEVVSKLKLAVSIYPLALVLQEIASDEVEIIWLAEKQGVHEITLQPKMASELAQAKGVLVTGYSLDFWAENLAQKFKLPVFRLNEKAPIVLDKRGKLNPHIWLSFAGLKAIANNIFLLLEKLDPANKAFYQTNLDRFLIQLENLKNTYQSKLAEVSSIPFLAYHDAFVPLFLEFKLNYQGSLVIAEESLAPKELLDLQRKIRDLKIKVIFNDSYQKSPRLVNFARENELKIISLDPLETGKIKIGQLLSIMQSNLESIYQALQDESTGGEKFDRNF